MKKLESNNWGKEKKDYIKEALEYTGKELSQLQRSAFVERVSANSWNYKFDAVKTYLDGIRDDYSYLNLSKNKTTTVMATQIALYKAWYMGVGFIDAKWGPQTMGCIKKFQRENDLPISWYLTKRTVDKLLKVAAEKQWLTPETKGQKKQEVKKPDEQPNKPTPKKKSPLQSTIDKKPEQTELLSQTDTTKLKNAIREIWNFNNIERRFIINSNKEVTRWGKKYINILWVEYEEYPSGLSTIDNSTSKNWYHNGWDYFIFWKYIDWKCYDGVKVSWDWENIIEKGEFNTLMDDTIEKWERVYENWKIEKWDFNSDADWALKSWTVTQNGKITTFTEV